MANNFYEVTTSRGVTVEAFAHVEIADGILYFYDADKKMQALYVLRNIIGAGRITEEEYEEFHKQPSAEVDEDSSEDEDPYRNLISPYLNS